MNKKETIIKINKIGKAATIITLIAKVIVFIGLACCILGLICNALIPAKSLTYRVDGKIYGYVDIRKFSDEVLTEEEKEDIIDGVSKNMRGDLDINGFEYGEVAVGIADNDKIEMSAQGRTVTGDIKSIIVAGCVTGLIYCIFTLVTLYFMGFLFKNIQECESPFNAKAVRHLKNLAYSTIPWVFIKSLGDTVSRTFMNGSWEPSVSINLHGVAVVLLLLALAYIFDYGVTLQQESDETI